MTENAEPLDARGGSRLPAILGLLAATAVWGGTFVVVKDGTEHTPVFDFLMWRFAIAALLMTAIRPVTVLRIAPDTIQRGACAGFLLGLSYILQTLGLQTISAAVSGFVTGLFVVLTPFLAWLLFREQLTAMAWMAVATATFGLGLITLNGVSFGAGEMLTLLSAVTFALHLLALGRWSPGRDAFQLTVIQMATACLMCFAGSCFQSLRIPTDHTSWTAILITAIFASAFAYMMQTWAQSRVTATQAAVVLTMEPVFAGLFAVLIGGESLAVSTVAGGVLVVVAMYMVEIPGASPAAIPENPGSDMPVREDEGRDDHVQLT